MVCTNWHFACERRWAEFYSAKDCSANRFSTVEITVQYRCIFVLLFGRYSLQLDSKEPCNNMLSFRSRRTQDKIKGLWNNTPSCVGLWCLSAQCPFHSNWSRNGVRITLNVDCVYDIGCTSPVSLIAVFTYQSVTFTTWVRIKVARKTER